MYLLYHQVQLKNVLFSTDPGLGKILYCIDWLGSVICSANNDMQFSCFLFSFIFSYQVPCRPETEENIKVQEENVLKTAAEKQKRKRPKVTYDLLKTNAGLPDVYHNFRMLYGESFRGKGHETSDLRRLLELYNRWQTRIFPGWPFDRFIDGVEKLSHSHIVKTELQDMRVDLLKVVTEAYKLPGHLTSDSDIKNDHHDTGADREEELNAELPDEDDQLLAMIARNGYGDSDDEEFGKYDGENKKEEYSNDEDDEILQMLAAEENYMDDEFGNDQGNTTSVPEN